MRNRLASMTVPTVLSTLLLCGYVFFPQANAQPQDASARWEYMTLNLNANMDNYADELNKHANRGWQYDGVLVQPYFHSPAKNSDQIVIVLKRPR
ncbi:DUF4177 domain-containing protein [Aureliella helgolandensis]|uniref:DUF4177 domain-containing protein n=1 Tax=Aureliella helgolandensis TaxID=2527968 RepID=A0A518G0V6_9BACT|nr:DUF4177 domain-containing protein [Aureliella helgolandensis]QDV22231.1 hypothetical protein Q31a_05150 [Aureliella helgolandensis]